jgi:hypothetical protein
MFPKHTIFYLPAERVSDNDRKDRQGDFKACQRREQKIPGCCKAYEASK